MTLHPANPILSTILQVLCSHPFTIEERKAMRMTVLTIHCDSRDAGRILGTACTLLNALRGVAMYIGGANDQPCQVELKYDRNGPRGERKVVTPTTQYNSSPIFDWVADVLDAVLDKDFALDQLNTDEFTIFEVIPYGYAPDKLFTHLNLVLSAYGAATGRPKLKIERADSVREK